MVFELKDENKKKVLGLIKNNMHELSIEAAIHGYSPAEVYVDNLDDPKSGLFKGEECIVLFGDPATSDFYWEIFEKIDYYEPVTCDNADWNSVVEEHHHNRAIRQYTRYTYKLNKEEYINSDKKHENVEVKILDKDDISSLEYENSEIVKEWATLQKIDTLPGLKLAAIVVKNNMIVSCSGVDCFYDNKIEIGINTNKDFRGNGYGIMAANELVKESFKYGIEEIGWHCVSTNKGSKRIAEKLGFKRICSYSSYEPEPYIENITDLTSSQWIENAKYYESKTQNDPVQYWIASQCWAKANKFDEVFKCFEILLENDIKWFIDCINDLDEFKILKSNKNWNCKLLAVTKNR